jgi:hypothetical protein
VGVPNEWGEERLRELQVALLQLDRPEPFAPRIISFDNARSGDDILLAGYPGSIGAIGDVLQNANMSTVLRAGIVSPKLTGVSKLNGPRHFQGRPF